MKQKYLTTTAILELDDLIQEPLLSPYRDLALLADKKQLTKKELKTLVGKIIDVQSDDSFEVSTYLLRQMGYDQKELDKEGIKLYLRQGAVFSDAPIKLKDSFVAFSKLNERDYLNELSRTDIPNFLVSGQYYGDIGEVEKDLAVIQDISDQYLSYQKDYFKNLLNPSCTYSYLIVLAGLSTSYLTESLVPVLIGSGSGLVLFFIGQIFKTPQKLVTEAKQLSLNSKNYLIGKEASQKIIDEYNIISGSHGHIVSLLYNGE